MIKGIQVYGLYVNNKLPIRSSRRALLPNHSNMSQYPSDSRNNTLSNRIESQRPGGSPTYPGGQQVLTQSQSTLD